MNDRKEHKRRALSDVADLAGIGCLVAAGWSWSGILGLALLGGALVLIGWVTDH